jgi:hypothetical protein
VFYDEEWEEGQIVEYAYDELGAGNRNPYLYVYCHSCDTEEYSYDNEELEENELYVAAVESITITLIGDDGRLVFDSEPAVSAQLEPDGVGAAIALHNKIDWYLSELEVINFADNGSPDLEIEFPTSNGDWGENTLVACMDSYTSEDGELYPPAPLDERQSFQRVSPSAGSMQCMHGTKTAG